MYSTHLTKASTATKVKKNQVQNSDGHYVFKADCFDRLTRFLMLGTEAPTYYASRVKKIQQSFDALEECLAVDVKQTIDLIVKMNKERRVPKRDASIACFAYIIANGDETARRLVKENINAVCNTATHLFAFANEAKEFKNGSMGGMLPKAVKQWYESKDPDTLGYQVAKYPSRNGWTHKDALRICHLKGKTPAQNALLRYIASDGASGLEQPRNGHKGHSYNDLPEIIRLKDALKNETNVKRVVEIINSNKLVTHEMINNDVKKDRKVWRALLVNMPSQALLRNLGRMTSIGVFDNKDSKIVCLEKLNSIDKGIHPMDAFVAKKQYYLGRGDKGSLSWSPISAFVTALDDMFYRLFKSVEPTNKDVCVALDVSGSMTYGDVGNGMTPLEASIVMAMVMLRVEPFCEVYAFSNSYKKLNVTAKTSYEEFLKIVGGMPFMSTDCSLPMIKAASNNKKFDCFQVYTDSETNCSRVHPFKALKDYRKSHVKDAKLAVIAMQVNDFTIADPNDNGMMDFVGFDSHTPALLQNFMRD